MRKLILILVALLGKFRFQPRKRRKFVKGQCDDIYPHY